LSSQKLSRICLLVKTGKIKPILDTEYDFSKIKEALQYINTGVLKVKLFKKLQINIEDKEKRHQMILFF